MLIEKNDKFFISDSKKKEEIRDFLRGNCNNPSIPTKTIDELYSLYVVLFFLHVSEYFSLPINIQKSDPPDYVIENQVTGHKTGIEVVSSATQSEQHAFNIMKKRYPEGSMLEKPYYAPGLNFKPTEGIKKPGEKLKSDGYGNYGQEKAWLDCINNCLNKKIHKLNKDHFPKYHSNQLIIYDDSGYFAKPDYIFSKLRKEHNFSHKINFDSVYLIMNCCHLFAADVFGQCKSFNIPHDLI